MKLRPGSLGAGGVRAAALAALAKHGTNKATPTLRESGATRHPPANILRPAVGTGSLAGDLSSLSLDKGDLPMARGDAQSSSSALPLPEEPTPAGQNLETALSAQT